MSSSTDRILEALGPGWLERASDLLAEPDPGPTPMLVDELLVAGAIGAVQGAPKASKTWLVLELALSIVTGRAAFGRFPVQAGPVVVVLEESGRAALHRRLGALARGRAIRPDELNGLHFAANRRVRLDDEDWQARLLAAVEEIRPAAVFLDPLARLKRPGRDENAQTDMAPLLDFMRELRDHADPAPNVTFVHHSGHAGTHLRGSSDLESYWESKVTLARSKDDPLEYDFHAEHRETEAGQQHRFRQSWDTETRSVRLRLVTTLEDEAREYLTEHPAASANDFHDAHGGNRQANLAAFKAARERWFQPLEPPGTTPLPEAPVGGSGGGASLRRRGPLGTTGLPAGSENGNQHPCDELGEDIDIEPGWLARSLEEDS